MHAELTNQCGGPAITMASKWEIQTVGGPRLGSPDGVMDRICGVATGLASERLSESSTKAASGAA